MAADYKGDVMFVLVTTDEAEHKRVIDFFGIKEEVSIRKIILTSNIIIDQLFFSHKSQSRIPEQANKRHNDNNGNEIGAANNANYSK